MKILYLPLAFLILNTACGKSLSDMLNMGKKPYTKHKLDPEFLPYVQAFEQQFNIKLSVPIVFKQLHSSKAGVCYMWSDGYREIEINSTHWVNFSEEQKEQLIFHELGHCVFNLGHDDSNLEYKRTCPNSIMRSSMFNQHEIDSCYVPEKTHYMENLHATQ
jgi:hypothetical protein